MKRIARNIDRLIEPALAFAVFVGLLVVVKDLFIDRRLPQPFYYRAIDPWMDWFNPAYWARDPGTYDSWRTFYPPASFIFLKFFTFPGCYVANEGWYSRDCDWYGAIVLHSLFVLNVYLTAKTFLKVDRRTALFRSFACAAGMPALGGLERGNLILIAYTCFILGHGPLLRSTRARWLAAGLAANFKVYMICPLFAYLVRRRWRWFEGAALSTAIIYLVTWGLQGSGTPKEIYDNLVYWGDYTSQIGGVLDLWYATSFTPVIQLLAGDNLPIVAGVGSWRVETFEVVIPIAIHIVQAMIIIATLAAWLRPEAVPTYRLANFATSLFLITFEGGGYTQMLIIFLAFLEPWKGIGRRWATVACYLLAIPGDIYIRPLLHWFEGSFLNSGPVSVVYWVTLGPFLRPAFVLSIPFALSCVTICAVWRDIREQGWIGRRRFRRDLPLLTAGGRTIQHADI